MMTSLFIFRCAVQIARYETNLDNSPSCGGDNLQSSYTDTSPSCDVYEQQALMDHVTNVVDIMWRLVSLLWVYSSFYTHTHPTPHPTHTHTHTHTHTQ